MIRCIIIEDQPPAQRVLKKFIIDLGNMELKAIFTDAIQAMDYLKTETIDLIFLDIHLPKISGIDFLKALTQKPHVILTTAFSEYALESYEYDVVDYLLKPFSFERFVQAVSRVPQARPSNNLTDNGGGKSYLQEVIFVKSGYELIKIDTSDIYYIQSDSDYTEIVTSEKKYLSQEPLRHWEDHMEQNKFVRIHKSFIINITKIDKIIGNQVYLHKKIALPLGRAYKENFMKLLLI